MEMSLFVVLGPSSLSRVPKATKCWKRFRLVLPVSGRLHLGKLLIEEFYYTAVKSVQVFTSMSLRL
jgi:hypothetical protein